MKKLIPLFAFAAFAFLASNSVNAEDGFADLFDGESFSGWRMSQENQDSWTIEDRAIVAKGNRSHLFYDVGDVPLKNFHLKVEVMTDAGSNGGIFFHTRYQAENWPKEGFECQVNVSHKDWRKTGSIYSVADLGHTPAKDGEWWTQEVIVEGKTATVKINGITVLVYQQPKGAEAGEKFARVFGEGTIALQAHDPKSVVRYRNIRLKRL